MLVDPRGVRLSARPFAQPPAPSSVRNRTLLIARPHARMCREQQERGRGPIATLDITLRSDAETTDSETVHERAVRSRAGSSHFGTAEPERHLTIPGVTGTPGSPAARSHRCSTNSR